MCKLGQVNTVEAPNSWQQIKIFYNCIIKEGYVSSPEETVMPDSHLCSVYSRSLSSNSRNSFTSPASSDTFNSGNLDFFSYIIYVSVTINPSCSTHRLAFSSKIYRNFFFFPDKIQNISSHFMLMAFLYQRALGDGTGFFFFVFLFKFEMYDTLQKQI